MKIPRAIMTAVLAALLAAPAATAGDPAAAGGDRQVTVMTQNLFLGTDLQPILAAPSLIALFAAAGAGWAQVQANDFPARAETLASLVAASKPDLVGLQEATLYRTDVPPDGGATPGEAVEYDYVSLLLGALQRRGLEYQAVSTF